MTERLRRLLEPPRRADLEADRIARATYGSALAFMAIVAVWLPTAYFVQDRSAFIPIFGLAFLTLLGASAYLARTGRAALGAWLIVGLLYLGGTAGVYVEGGLRGTSHGNFVVVVLAATLFLSLRAAVVMAAVSAATAVSFLIAENQGLLSPDPGLRSSRVAVSLLTQMGLVLVLVRLAVGRLQEARSFIGQVAEATPHAVYVYDLGEDAIVYGNSAVFDEFGFPRAAGRGAFARVIAPEDRDKLLAHVQALREASDEQVVEVEYRAQDPDGGLRWVHDRACVFDRNPDGSVRQIIGASEDVTQVRAAEQAVRDADLQLRQAERMRALGQLAGGVAHDFNNYLTVILGSAQEALDHLGDDPAVRAALDDVVLAAHGSTELTHRLLAFSQRRAPRRRVLDVNAILADVGRLLRRLLPENVAIRTVPGGGLGHVRSDPAQIEQVLVNLALNARDAMPEGGELTLETSAVQLDAGEAAELGLAPGEYVRLRVADTGVGMSPETLDRIFEPLFTTKAATAGTGLGLAIVDDIVRQNDGAVRVASEPGRGTVFELHLPCVDARPDAPDARGEGATRGGNEHVLLVEDEDMVRAYSRRVLEAAGYRVTECGDGNSALEVFSATPDDFDVLFTDIMLPGRTGGELAEAVRAQRPGLPILFASGYTGAGAVRFDDKDAVLDKPFTPAALRAALRQALDGA